MNTMTKMLAHNRNTLKAALYDITHFIHQKVPDFIK